MVERSVIVGEERSGFGATETSKSNQAVVVWKEPDWGERASSGLKGPETPRLTHDAQICPCHSLGAGQSSTNRHSVGEFSEPCLLIVAYPYRAVTSVQSVRLHAT